MELKKYLSREFLIACALIAVASIAMFEMPDKVDFLAWAGACGGFVSIFTAGLVTTKIKGPKP